MPQVEQRVKSILKSAELSFELGIINATRFGPLIHANVPDYAEILLKVFVDENNLKPTQTDFPGHVAAVSNYFSINCPADQQRFQQIGDYFIDTRRAFRNPLHHTDRVQGYVIERSEALLCLLRFNELLLELFPTSSANKFDELNYPCYIQFIKLEYDQNLGRNNPRYYQAVMSALQRLEYDNAYHCPTDFDSSRLVAIRYLFHLDVETYTRYVFNYRPHIRELIADIAHQSPQPLSSKQLLLRLKQTPNIHDLALDEVDRCLAFMEGQRFDNYGILRGSKKITSSGNQIIRYYFVT